MKKSEEVVDLMGATKKVINNMVSFYNMAQEQAKERMIPANKYWAFITKDLKEKARISDYTLLMAGMPVPGLMDIIGEGDGYDLTYKKLILTMQDGSTKQYAVADVLPKLAPHTKQFEDPLQALVFGDSDAILKVIQKIFGDDVTQWSIPSEKQECVFETLSALCLVEMYNLGKFEVESDLFESTDAEVTVKEGSIEKLVDAFDKTDSAYVIDLFPHVDSDYPMMLVQESQSVLNTLSSDEMDRLWPNINREYLVNLKESELQDLYNKVVEGCGMQHEPKKSKKKAKKEGVAGPALRRNRDSGRGAPALRGNRVRGACGGTPRKDGSGAGVGNRKRVSKTGYSPEKYRKVK